MDTNAGRRRGERYAIVGVLRGGSQGDDLPLRTGRALLVKEVKQKISGLLLIF